MMTQVQLPQFFFDNTPTKHTTNNYLHVYLMFFLNMFKKTGQVNYPLNTNPRDGHVKTCQSCLTTTNEPLNSYLTPVNA